MNPQFAGFTYGYNRSVLANRVHDVLTLVGFAKHMLKSKKIYLVGWEEAGPWTVMASALAGDSVKRTAVDLQQFHFENIKSTSHEMMLPGAVKYGGMPAFLALCVPQEMLAHNHKGTATGHIVKAAYEAAGANEKLTRNMGKMEPMKNDGGVGSEIAPQNWRISWFPECPVKVVVHLRPIRGPVRVRREFRHQLRQVAQRGRSTFLDRNRCDGNLQHATYRQIDRPLGNQQRPS